MRWERKTNMNKWCQWFAWRPIKLSGTLTMVWFEKVWKYKSRKGNYYKKITDDMGPNEEQVEQNIFAIEYDYIAEAPRCR